MPPGNSAAAGEGGGGEEGCEGTPCIYQVENFSSQSATWRLHLFALSAYICYHLSHEQSSPYQRPSLRRDRETSEARTEKLDLSTRGAVGAGARHVRHADDSRRSGEHRGSRLPDEEPRSETDR